ncbi:MAG: RNA polymerase sigma factor [Bacteroidales bacterium]|nr:RNA polymerase sigma factor [Bacteroidales bacterium]
MKTNYNDSDILALLLEDENRGFRLLVEKYSKRLYWHIRRLVLIHEDADDALQNTFVNCWKNIGKFREQSSLYTWLYSIATNEALMLIRKRNRLSESSLETIKEVFSISEEGGSWFDGDEAQELLQNAILTLPEKQRVVFSMRYYDELSYEDISKITGTTVGALKASYFHAVRKIEKIIVS